MARGVACRMAGVVAGRVRETAFETVVRIEERGIRQLVHRLVELVAVEGGVPAPVVVAIAVSASGLVCFLDGRIVRGQHLRDEVPIVRARGVEAIILGCTEIPLIVDPNDSPLPNLDSTRLLARAALRKALTNYEL